MKIAHLAIALVATSAWAGDVIFEQPPSLEAEWFATDDCGTAGLFGKAADDASIGSGSIDRIGWWGFHYYDREGPQDFLIEFFAQTPEGGPGELITDRLVEGVPGMPAPEAPLGHYYYYEVEIEPIMVGSDEPFMVSIQAQCTYFWRWQTGTGNDDALWYIFDHEPHDDLEWGEGETGIKCMCTYDMSLRLFGELNAVPTRATSWSAIKSEYR